MDNNFQTSFIPKKPLAEERPQVIQHTSILSFIATLLFFGALAAAAGMYFYKASLTKNIMSMSSQLDSSRNAFEPSLISTLQKLDRRIGSANTLLAGHIVVSPIFNALQINTLKSIQFTKFTYITPTDKASAVLVKMAGKARDYASIALQSDQLATNPNIHNSIFSNLSLDQKTGMVSFDLTFDVDASLVHFVNHLDVLTQQSGAPLDSGTTSAGTTTGTTGTTGGGAAQNQQQSSIGSGGTGGTAGAGTTGSGTTGASGTTGGSATTGSDNGRPLSQTEAQILQNLATSPVAPH